MADCFVGRQPIFDRDNNVCAYELLYRSSLDNEIGAVNRTVATSQVIINAFVEIGLENIVGQHRAFLNVNENFLVDPDLLCFPPDKVVLELPETTPATAEIITALEGLRAGGYTMALNGYRHDLPVAGLIDFADIVKLDALTLDDETLRMELESLGDRKVALVAKRVETMERRDQLADLGFQFFQGEYIARPEIIVGKQLPTNRTAVLELVTKICDPDIDVTELEELISMDAGLSLRILRFVNSPLSGVTNEVDSIHHAVVLVGRNVIKNWATLLALAGLDNNIPELVTTAFVRAKLCEQLAAERNLPGQESFFTVGLFSMMDAMMAKPMDQLLETLPFTADVKSALIDRSGIRGEAILCAQDLERGAPEGARFQELPSERISQLYLNSMSWADLATASMGGKKSATDRVSIVKA